MIITYDFGLSEFDYAVDRKELNNKTVEYLIEDFEGDLNRPLTESEKMLLDKFARIFVEDMELVDDIARHYEDELREDYHDQALEEFDDYSREYDPDSYAYEHGGKDAYWQEENEYDN